MFWIDFTANKLLKENIGTKLTEGEINYLVRLLKHLYIMYSAPFFVNLGFIIMTNCNFDFQDWFIQENWIHDHVVCSLYHCNYHNVSVM